MKAGIISLNFSPGHLSHIWGLRSLLEELRVDVEIILGERYRRYVEKSPKNVLIGVKKHALNKLDYAIFQNPSTLNYPTAKLLREHFNTKIVYHYHEPIQYLRAYATEGIKDVLKILVAHHYSVKMLRLADVIVLHSRFAREQYLHKDVRFNDNIVYVPLLFEDEQSSLITQSNRFPDGQSQGYFTFLGHAVPAHNFSLFLQLIGSGLLDDLGIKYQIVTRTNISSVLKNNALRNLMASGRLVVKHGHPISERDLNAAINSSSCIWSMYSRCTQSGVVPKAFMFGVPVVSSSAGSLKEYVKDNYNGVICSTSSIENIAEAIKVLFAKRSELSNGARKTFMEFFYYRSNIEGYRHILENLAHSSLI